LHGLAIRAKTIREAMSIDYCYPELVVIGGASVYNQTMSLADKLMITHVDASFTADTFFPIIDPVIWKINSVVDSKNEMFNYKFVEYVRNESMGIIE
jgi:dihydrofolate reductase